MADKSGKGRIEWVDVAKGITMLLVIAGHSVFGGLRGLIFSFHMPLFFILSGLTYRCSTDMGQLWHRCQKAAVHLLVPALLLVGADILIEIIQLSLSGQAGTLGAAFWIDKGVSLLFFSGSKGAIGDLQIARVGIPWFLMVLFLSRTLFDLLHLKLDKWSAPVCILLAVAGWRIGQWNWLPLSFDVALVALMFLTVGQWSRGLDLRTGALWKTLLALGLWAGGILLIRLMDGRYLEMATRRYEPFVITCLTAVAGTATVCLASVLCENYLPLLKRPLVYLGEHSLVALCVHTLDRLWEDLYLLPGLHPVLSACLRIVVDLGVFLLYMFVSGWIRTMWDKKERSV